MNINPELNGLFYLALERIKEYRKIILASPRDPDADSCSSIFSFREFLKTMWPDKEIMLYAPNLPEGNSLFSAYRTLGNPMKDIQTSIPEDFEGLCIVFDYGNFHRLAISDDTVSKLSFVGFDEHGKNTGLPSEGVEIVDTDSSSTTMLLSYFFKYAGYAPTPDVATCLFTGIVADTGRFSHSIKEHTFEVCAYLERFGARTFQILQLSSQKISLKRLKIQNSVRAERVAIDESLGLAFLWFSREDLARWNAEEKDALSVYGTLKDVEEIRLTAAFYEKADGAWYCSLRSTGGLAKEVAVSFGGGGHPNAAGFIPQPVKPDELVQQLKKALRELTDAIKN